MCACALVLCVAPLQVHSILREKPRGMLLAYSQSKEEAMEALHSTPKPRPAPSLSERQVIWFYQCFIKDQGMEAEFNRFIQHVRMHPGVEPEEEDLC